MSIASYKGAKPGDLPIQEPVKFDFIVNLKTAKALSLTIPPSILAREPCVAASASHPMSARSSWPSRSRHIGPRPTSRQVRTQRRLTCSRWFGAIGGPASAALDLTRWSLVPFWAKDGDRDRELVAFVLLGLLKPAFIPCSV
jgi:hypothetical protein